MRTRVRMLLCFGASVLLPAAASFGAQAPPAAVADSGSKTPAAIEDQPLAPYRADLLELAFKAASAFPLNPHIKNRSRAQEEVIGACLELDQPKRALGWIDRIDNWRRGACYADYAYYCAKHGCTDVQRYLDLALEIAENNAKSEDSQDWERDRIRVKIARTYVALGNEQQAARFERNLENSESGKADAVRAEIMDEKSFDDLFRLMEKRIASGNFDLTQNALEALARLYGRTYDDPARRARVEEKIKSSWTKLPLMIRVGIFEQLVQQSLDHKDQAKALALIDEAVALIEGAHWSASDQIPMEARLASLRCRAGDKATARRAVEAMYARYDGERERIVNIDRAGTLRPLAEAYQTLGDTASALTVYRMAVEVGVENPNSRPRALDLTSTCCSMALHAVEPDAKLRARMQEIFEKLGNPW